MKKKTRRSFDGFLHYRLLPPATLALSRAGRGGELGRASNLSINQANHFALQEKKKPFFSPKYSFFTLFSKYSLRFTALKSTWYMFCFLFGRRPGSLASYWLHPTVLPINRGRFSLFLLSCCLLFFGSFFSNAMSRSHGPQTHNLVFEDIFLRFPSVS